MAKMGLFSRLTTPKKIPPTAENEVAIFGDKFKTIVKCDYDVTHAEKINWLNENSAGAVDVKLFFMHSPPLMVVGFENEADALIFKIRYL
jgi:hypothetical protein